MVRDLTPSKSKERTNSLKKRKSFKKKKNVTNVAIPAEAEMATLRIFVVPMILMI
jgi:hypothetical protein